MLNKKTILSTKTKLGGTNKLNSNSKLNNKTKANLKVHAKSGSTRLVGDKAEAKVNKIFTDQGFDLEETRNSGALNFDGDCIIHMSSVEGDFIRAEVKKRNTTGFTVQKNHWETIVKKSLKHQGIPALINVNKEDKALITMDVNDLAELLKAMKDDRKSK